MDPLENLLRKAAENAASLLQKDGYVSPLAILIPPGGPATVVAMWWESEPQKAAAVAAVKELARSQNATVVFVVESWVLAAQPSHAPKWVEAVVVAAFSPHRVLAGVLPFTRDSQGHPVPGELAVYSASCTVDTEWDPWPDRKPAS